MAATAPAFPGSALTVSAYIPLSRLSTDARSPDSAVCHGRDGKISWGEFTGRVARLAEALAAQPSRSTVVACTDADTFLVALFALWQGGRTAVIPPNFLPATLEKLSLDNDSVLDDRSIPSIAGDRPPRSGAPLDVAACRLVLYTSGSSGEPKYIEKTLAQLETEVATLENVWGQTMGNGTVLATVPHHHIYGLLFRLLWPLAAGRVFDATVCANPVDLRNRIALHPDHTLVSSPAHLGRFPLLMDLNGWRPQPRLIFSSGAPLAAESAAAYRSAFGSAPTEVFGSTETGGVAWRQQAPVKGGDAWTPLPGVAVTQDATGALLLDSPFLPRQGWRMDDAVTPLTDGRFRLEGRLDRIVKLEGKRLSLPEMEDRLKAHPWVASAVVLALAGEGRLGAVVAPSTAGQAALNEAGRQRVSRALRAHLGQSFEAVLLPRRFRFVAELPLDDRGKLSLASVQSLFAPHDRTDA